MKIANETVSYKQWGRSQRLGNGDCLSFMLDKMYKQAKSDNVAAAYMAMF